MQEQTSLQRIRIPPLKLQTILFCLGWFANGDFTFLENCFLGNADSIVVLFL